MGKQKEQKLMARIESLEIELDTFNKKYRQLQVKFKSALELIQKLYNEPTN